MTPERWIVVILILSPVVAVIAGYFYSKGVERGREIAEENRKRSQEEQRKFMQDAGYDPQPRYLTKEWMEILERETKTPKKS